MSAAQKALLARLEKFGNVPADHFDRRTGDALVRRGLAHYEREQRSATAKAMFGRDGSARYFYVYNLVLGGSK